MGLVEYSDSESEGEDVAAVAPKVVPQAKTAVFQKAAPGKLQVALPSLKPEPGQKSDGDGNGDGPPPKRARTAGAFSAFNALLPAPKRTATAAAALKKGVSLKTSSEAAFSRNPLPRRTDDDDETYTAPELNQTSTARDFDDVPEAKTEEKKVEVGVEEKEKEKVVGKATRFLPLSVSNKKRRKPRPKTPAPEVITGLSTRNGEGRPSTTALGDVAAEPRPPKPKPKKSLFSVTQEEEDVPAESNTGDYEPITIDRQDQDTQELLLQSTDRQQRPPPPPPPANPNSLEAVATDMNLTPAQRRQLFGRGGKDVHVQHFDLDAQYAENERARLAGEVVEHRAVKAIAPGKHSLQQLVNNSQSQQEALKDKWADGKRARGEGGSKYGWGT